MFEPPSKFAPTLKSKSLDQCIVLSISVTIDCSATYMFIEVLPFGLKCGFGSKQAARPAPRFVNGTVPCCKFTAGWPAAPPAKYSVSASAEPVAEKASPKIHSFRMG